MKNAQSFKTMFGLMCIVMLCLTILGTEYTVTEGKAKNRIKDKENRIISLFNTGLMYFNLCFNSYGIPKIRCDFILYEV